LKRRKLFLKIILRMFKCLISIRHIKRLVASDKLKRNINKKKERNIKTNYINKLNILIQKLIKYKKY